MRVCGSEGHSYVELEAIDDELKEKERELKEKGKEIEQLREQLQSVEPVILRTVTTCNTSLVEKTLGDSVEKKLKPFSLFSSRVSLGPTPSPLPFRQKGWGAKSIRHRGFPCSHLP